MSNEDKGYHQPFADEKNLDRDEYGWFDEELSSLDDLPERTEENIYS